MKYLKPEDRHRYPFILPLVLIVALLVSISAGVVWAVQFMTTEDDPVVNTFTPAQTSIEVKESFDGTVKENVYIANTGSTADSKGPAVYVRVKLLAYWYALDSEHIAAKSNWTPSFTPGTDWILIGDYYYYKKPIAAGENTSNLISSITLERNETDGTRQVLEIAAEAIQSTPATAVSTAWSVALDANGYIKAN